MKDARVSKIVKLVFPFGSAVTGAAGRGVRTDDCVYLHFFYLPFAPLGVYAYLGVGPPGPGDLAVLYSPIICSRNNFPRQWGKLGGNSLLEENGPTTCTRPPIYRHSFMVWGPQGFPGSSQGSTRTGGRVVGQNRVRSGDLPPARLLMSDGFCLLADLCHALPVRSETR